jgi:hypothetical protein
MFTGIFGSPMYYGLIRSTDNGEHLAIQHYFDNDADVFPCLADAFSGVVYHIKDSILDKSADSGSSWNSTNKPKGLYSATGDLPGELYIADGSYTHPALYRSSDFGASWGIMTQSFTTDHYALLDVGSTAGEIYAVVMRPVWDTIVLKYSNNYGTSYSSIVIDTSLVINSNVDGGPLLTHGTLQGEFYLIRYGVDGYYIYHTIDNGRTFEFQSKEALCPQCLYNRSLCSFTAGRTPGSFYFMRAPRFDSLGTIITNLCIDYSHDYGKTFETHCYILDSTITTGLIQLPKIPGIQLNCAPNPVNQNAEINYTLTEKGNIDLSLYNSQGICTKVLLQGNRSAGRYSIKWNGTDGLGNPLSSGVYLLILNEDGMPLKTEKIIVIE